MKVSSTKYPLDILLCILWSIVLLPIALLSMDTTVRTLLGLPFLLFIPGYVLIFALFPAKKTDRGIDVIERIALSFGLSIAIVPLIGLALNYTPWMIRLEPILLSVFLFILTIGLVGIYRWKKIDPEERFIISFQLAFPKQESNVDRALTIILVIAILIVIASLLYVITMPKTGETFTELYILGPTGKAEAYPRNLTIGENATLIIGVTNYEQRTINYTIEIWLINQTIVYNNQTQSNETHYNQMWYQDTLTTTLTPREIDIEEPWQPQWTDNYTFAIDKPGEFKLAFLLFTAPTESYQPNIDYHEITDEKLSSAYRENHLWITVQ